MMIMMFGSKSQLRGPFLQTLPYLHELAYVQQQAELVATKDKIAKQRERQLDFILLNRPKLTRPLIWPKLLYRQVHQESEIAGRRTSSSAVRLRIFFINLAQASLWQAGSSQLVCPKLCLTRGIDQPFRCSDGFADFLCLSLWCLVSFSTAISSVRGQ